MKAVVLEEQGVINVREVPDVPAPGLGELKIAPHTVGVCCLLYTSDAADE